MFNNLIDYIPTGIGGAGVTMMQVAPAVHSSNLQDGMTIAIGLITLLAQIFHFKKNIKNNNTK